MKEKILITGIAGLFGSNISRYFLKRDYNVVGIDNLFGGYKENIPENAIFYNEDLKNSKNIDNIIKKEKPDYILHFAAYAAEGLSHYIRNYNYQNNLISTVNIINAAINNNTKKVIFTSSMAVYGDVNEPPFTEDMKPLPVDPYGIAKYASELDFNNAKKHFGLNYSIIRPHNVIGKYQNIWDKYRNVIGIWIRQMLENKPLTVYGDGMQKRAFSDILYYSYPIEKLLYEHSGEIFNLGSDHYVTIIDALNIFRDCAQKYGFKTNINFLEERNEVKNAYCDHTKAKTQLNFNDNTDLEKTILEMIDWAMKQPKHETKIMDYEIEKNLYSYWGNN